jgi:sec-independent protein translocase protein TatB
MVLFIFESLGTSELILIGIVALIFLGPRKLPLMARKIGKMMADFRSTAGEFRETWSREVNFEEEAKLLRLKELEEDFKLEENGTEKSVTAEPTVKELDPEEFRRLKESKQEPSAAPAETQDDASTTSENEKANWL